MITNEINSNLQNVFVYFVTMEDVDTNSILQIFQQRLW